MDLDQQKRKKSFDITYKQFKKYENVRRSGIINMLDFKMIEHLNGLSKTVINLIIKNYGYLYDKYEKELKEND